MMKGCELFYHLAFLATLEEREVKVRLDTQQHLHRRLQHVEHNLQKVATAVSSAAEQADMDLCLLKQYNKQVNGFKLKVFDVLRRILSMDGA